MTGDAAKQQTAQIKTTSELHKLHTSQTINYNTAGEAQVGQVFCIKSFDECAVTYKRQYTMAILIHDIQHQQQILHCRDLKFHVARSSHRKRYLQLAATYLHEQK